MDRQTIFLCRQPHSIESNTPHGDERRTAIYRGDALIGGSARDEGPPSEGWRTWRPPRGHIPRRCHERRLNPGRKDRRRKAGANGDRRSAIYRGGALNRGYARNEGIAAGRLATRRPLRGHLPRRCADRRLCRRRKDRHR